MGILDVTAAGASLRPVSCLRALHGHGRVVARLEVRELSELGEHQPAMRGQVPDVMVAINRSLVDQPVDVKALEVLAENALGEIACRRLDPVMKLAVAQWVLAEVSKDKKIPFMAYNLKDFPQPG